MEIVEKRVAELKPYSNNPRNNDGAIEYVAESIKNFGFKVPLVIDENNVIVCGHTRYLACRKLGINSVPCVVANDLTEDQIRAFRIADNKVAEFSNWDIEKLNFEMEQLPEIDFDAYGFLEDANLIDSLLEQAVGVEGVDKEAEFFSISFLFPNDTKTSIMGKIKEMGKDYWNAKVLELFEV